MQEYKDAKVVKAETEKSIDRLTEDMERDFQSGLADSARIAPISVGDEFEIKGLKFKITKTHNRGRITARLKGRD